MEAPASQLQQLFEVLELEHPEDPVAYHSLFLQDSQLSQVQG